jgi:hypothetical protein
MKSYKEFIDKKKAEYGDKFDESDLNPAFIRFYESQDRITVDFGYEKKHGRIGVTTGWKPCFLLILTKRSLGSSYTIGEKDKVVK